MYLKLNQAIFDGQQMPSPETRLNFDGLFAQKFGSSLMNHGLVKIFTPTSKARKYLNDFDTMFSRAG